MLSKIIKYDLRAMWRFSSAMFIAMGLVSVVCCALLYFTISFSEAENIIMAIMMVTGFYAIGILAIAVMAVICEFMVFYRYYKSMFTDEGYLTMVIPVRTVTLLNAKLLSSLIFTALISVITLAAVGVSVVLPIALSEAEFVKDTWGAIKEMLLTPSEGKSYAAVAIVTVVIQMLVSFIESVVIVIAAITVGAVLMNRNKILGAICIYLAIDLIHSILVSISEIVLVFPTDHFDAQLIVSSVIKILLSLGFGALLYFISLNTLKKRLNI